MLLIPIPRLFGVKKIVATAMPLLTLAVGWAWQHIQPTRAATLIILLLALMPTIMIIFLPKDDWQAVAQTAEANITTNEIVMVDVHFQAIPYWHYAPERLVHYGIDSQLQLNGPFADLGQPLPVDEIPANVEGVWFIASRFPGDPIPGSSDEKFLDERWKLAATYPFYRLELRHYRANP